MIIRIILLSISWTDTMIDVRKLDPKIIASVIYTIATVIGQGMTFLGIIVFTRIMPQSEYGNYSTYFAYVAILEVFIGANLFVSINNAYIDYKDDILEYRKSVLCLSAFIGLVVNLLCYLANVLIFRSFSGLIIIIASIHAYGFFVLNYKTYSANMENDYKTKTVLLILPYVLQFLISLIYVVIIPGTPFQNRAIGSTIGIGIVAAIVFFEMICCKGSIILLDYWKYALSISVPSIIASVSYMIMQQSDKIMITSMCGSDETAVYSVIYYLSYAIYALNSAIAPVRQMWIFNKLNSGNVSISSVIQKWYLLLVALATTVLLLLGEPIIRILAPSNYWKFEYIIPFLIGACETVLYGFYMDVLSYYKKNIQISVSVLICAVINVILNALLIPVFGAVAACYTTAIAYCLLFVITMFLSDRIQSGIYSLRLFVIFSIWIGLMAGIYLFTKGLFIIRLVCFLVALCVLSVYVYKRKLELISIIRID